MKPVLPGYPILKVGVAMYLETRVSRGRRLGQASTIKSLSQRWRIMNGVDRSTSPAKMNLQKTIGVIRPRET